MSIEQLFEFWAPPGGLWSPWVKPVLFAAINPAMMALEPPRDWQAFDTSFAPPITSKTAIVVDLPGETSVLAGIALAYKGYRPIALFNSCLGPSAVLDVSAIVKLLGPAAEVLDRLNLPWDAPPAFLLDSRRLDSTGRVNPGMFDNRWIALPQDFPSASLLQSRGVERALLFQDRHGQPREDLAHVLRRWQEAGMQIHSAPIGGKSEPIEILRPAKFKWLWYALLATLGLRRNSAGGFGSMIPIPSSGGGYSGFG